MIDIKLLKALPKTDLHVHLDGSLREETLIELSRERGVKLPSYTVEGLNELVFKENYSNLGEYLHGFMYTCAVLRDAESLERCAYELAWDNINEGVRYIEVRFAPQLNMGPDLSFDDVLLAVNRGLAKAAAEHLASDPVAKAGEPPFKYGIIVCAMRMFTAGFSEWYARFLDVLREASPKLAYTMASQELARAAVRCRDEHGVPIVGFDLAGPEDGYPAADHVDAYKYAHHHFMKKTVHAGEAYGPESIFQAITGLNADRIGHGYHLCSPELCGPDIADPNDYVKRLTEYISDRRVTIEVCITSNLQTNPNIGNVKNHVYGQMLKDRLSATLCTDNRLVSHTTMTKELEIAVNAFDMDLTQLRHTLIYGFKRSFFPDAYIQKRAYVRHIIDYYDSVVTDWQKSNNSE